MSARDEREAAVAPDGSPIEVFRRLPPGPAPRYVASAVPPGAALLELGCGAGRLTRALVARGYRVVAVDQSPEMLRHVEGAEVVCADVDGLDLGRTFDGVVLASYLVNHPSRGPAYLQTCRRHVAAGGAVVVQRYDPGWAREAAPGEALVGDVRVEVVKATVDGDVLAATVAYAVGGRRWEQEVTARILDDAGIDRVAREAGLAVDRWLDEFRTWARLVPAPGS